MQQHNYIKMLVLPESIKEIYDKIFIMDHGVRPLLQESVNLAFRSTV